MAVVREDARQKDWVYVLLQLKNVSMDYMAGIWPAEPAGLLQGRTAMEESREYFPKSIRIASHVNFTREFWTTRGKTLR